MSSTSAASRPAVRIFSCSSGVFIVIVMVVDSGLSEGGKKSWDSALLAAAGYGIKRAPKRQLIHTLVDTFRWVPHK
jgi:hypothetical protein